METYTRITAARSVRIRDNDIREEGDPVLDADAITRLNCDLISGRAQLAEELRGWRGYNATLMGEHGDTYHVWVAQLRPDLLIDIHISTVNDGQWGPETTPEQAQILARNCAALLTVYTERYWPGASADIATKHEPGTGISVRPQGDATDTDDVEEVAEDLHGYLVEHWDADPLWEEGFDAAAYVARHP